MGRSYSKWVTGACVVSFLVAGRASVALGQADAPAPKPTAGTPKTVPPKPVTPKQDAKADTPEPTREERTEKAKALLEQGEAKLSEGDVPAALELFRASNASMRSPQALFRIAVCLDKMDKLAASDEAAAAFHRFLGLPPPEAMTDERRIATERLAELAKGTLKVTSSPAEVEIRIDGGAALKTPAEARVSPGRHVVTASAPGYEPSTKELEIGTRGVLELAIVLQALPAAAPVPVPAPHEHTHPAPIDTGVKPVRPIYAYAAFGVAAVSAAVGVGYGFRALSAKSDYDKAPSRDLANRQQESALVSDTAFGAAVVLGVVGTVFLLHASDEKATPAHAASVTVRPIVSPSAQGAAVSLTF